MNEATFEARAHEAIKYIFPNYASLELTHQVIFSVKVGHDEINVKPSTKKPRLDILIKQKDSNLAVLELKKPEHSLTAEDRDQGLSYARLLVPMPPLVIVSNGKQTRFYETVSGKTLEITTPDAEELEKKLAQALEIAAEQKDIAIRTLLGKDPLIWEKVIEDLNRVSFDNHTGSIRTLFQPIADFFHLPRRQIARRIIELVSGNNPVVTVTGHPMVGKTNVLYEICQLTDTPFVPVYINTVDCQFGIFQYLANHFTTHLFSTTSKDDVRHWLLHGIMNNRHPAGKIVLIVDGVRYSEQNLRNEIDELIEFCTRGTSCSLIIACDSSNYNLMAHVQGRPSKTLFGKRALRVEIDNLDDDEFNQAKEYLMENWSVVFGRGAEYSRELRNPRILRMIISQSPQKRNEDTQLLIPSLLSFRTLNWVLEEFSNGPKFIDDMVKLVKASLENDSPEILEFMVSYGRGYVAYDKAESLLGEERIDRLLQQGHVDWFTDKAHNQYIAPKVPELLAAAAVEALLRQANKMEFDQAVDYVLKHSERLPYGDLIAANVFERLSRDSDFPLYELIVRLGDEPPRIETVRENFVGAVYFDKIGLVKIPDELLKDTSEEIRSFANVFPWLVLSRLATEPMAVEGEEDKWYVYRAILKTVGGYRNVLRRFDPIENPEDLIGYNTHTLQSKDGEKGEVLCGEVGIIEPITNAMQRGFYDLPEEMLKICRYAVEEKNPFLSHRLHNAALSMVSVDKEDSARAVKQALRMLSRVH